MFGAVALFIVLLVAMLYLAFVRFRNPPQPRAAPAPVGIESVGGGQALVRATSGAWARMEAGDAAAAGSGNG
jgi:hypothetical protein